MCWHSHGRSPCCSFLKARLACHAGIYLPTTALLGGRLYVQPHGHNEAERDVIRCVPWSSCEKVLCTVSRMASRQPVGRWYCLLADLGAQTGTYDRCASFPARVHLDTKHDSISTSSTLAGHAPCSSPLSKRLVAAGCPRRWTSWQRSRGSWSATPPWAGGPCSALCPPTCTSLSLSRLPRCLLWSQCPLKLEPAAPGCVCAPSQRACSKMGRTGLWPSAHFGNLAAWLGPFVQAALHCQMLAGQQVL